MGRYGIGGLVVVDMVDDTGDCWQMQWSGDGHG